MKSFIGVGSIFPILALALACCAYCHLTLAWQFREPRWRSQMVGVIVIAVVEILASFVLMNPRHFL